MDASPPQRWGRDKWVTVFSSHQPTIREVTECLGLGLCASSYNSNRGIPKFDEPNYQKLSNEVAKLSKELPQERDALLDFAADPESLNQELDDLLNNLGVLIWAKDANRSRLLNPDPSKKTYYKDLFLDNPEDREILKTHLHRWIVIKACYYIRNIRLKRKSGVDDVESLADNDRERLATLSPKPQLLVKVRISAAKLRSNLSERQNQDGTPQPAAATVSESPRTRRTSRLLAGATQRPSSPVSNQEAAATQPRVTLASNATPPPPFTPANPKNAVNEPDQQPTDANPTAQSDSPKPPPPSATPPAPEVPEAPPVVEEQGANTSTAEANPNSESHPVPSDTVAGRKRSYPNGLDSNPRKVSRANLAMASPTTENVPPLPSQANQQQNAPPLPSQPNQNPSPVTLVAHVDAAGRPMLGPLSSNVLNVVAKPPGPTETAPALPTFTAVNAPSGHHHHHHHSHTLPSNHKAHSQNGFASPYPSIAPNPGPGGPLPLRSHPPNGAHAHAGTHTPNGTHIHGSPHTQAGAQIHNSPHIINGNHAHSRSETPNGTPIQHHPHVLHREHSGDNTMVARPPADLEMMKFELLDTLMKYLFPKPGVPLDQQRLFYVLEQIWRYNAPTYQAQMGHLYTYQTNVLLAWIEERRKIAQLRMSMETQPGCQAPEMIDRLLAMNDLRVMHLKWKALVTQVGGQTLSPEDLLCKTFATMTKTEGTEHLFREGLNKLDEGLFEFLRSDDMKITMNLR
ncbi:hypothetical protein BCR34DRAFT_593564 [Clohesyomyces aquaticus]|uniref:Uncharacterized protein n=1 Tax=Clohesyomyces aquaticus TaxID=1231657 RepID=A0A1Y1YH00_9PLEO|nr:hypothetical protein BCR34DRAFT_593564 [Clohesyomyces aquaticus]